MGQANGASSSNYHAVHDVPALPPPARDKGQLRSVVVVDVKNSDSRAASKAADADIMIISNMLASVCDRIYQGFLFIHLIYGLVDVAMHPPLTEYNNSAGGDGRYVIHRIALSIALLTFDALSTSLNCYAATRGIKQFSTSEDEQTQQRERFPFFYAMIKWQKWLWFAVYVWSVIAWSALPALATNTVCHVFTAATCLLAALHLAIFLVAVFVTQCM